MEMSRNFDANLSFLHLEQSISVIENLNLDTTLQNINEKCKVHGHPLVALNLDDQSNSLLLCPKCLFDIDYGNVLFFEDIKNQNVGEILSLKAYEGFKNIYSKIKTRLEDDKEKDSKEDIFVRNTKLFEEFEEKSKNIKESFDRKLKEIRYNLIELLDKNKALNILQTESFVTERLDFKEIFNQVKKGESIDKLRDFVKNYNTQIEQKVKSLKIQMEMYDLQKNGVMIKKLAEISNEIEAFINKKLSPENLLGEYVNDNYPINNQYVFNPLNKLDIIELKEKGTLAEKGNEYNYSAVTLDLVLRKSQNSKPAYPIKWKQRFGGLKGKTQYIAFGIIEASQYLPKIDKIEYLEKHVIGISSNRGCYNMSIVNKFERKDDFTIEFIFDPMSMTFQIVEVYLNESGVDSTFKAHKKELDPLKTYIPIVILGYPGNTVQIISE